MFGKCKICGTGVGTINLTNGTCKLCLENGATNSTSDYSASKNISKIISFIGWVFVRIGAIIVIVGLVQSSEYGGFALLGFGLGTSVSGLFLVIAGQITRAIVDNASHTKEILQIIKQSYKNKST